MPRFEITSSESGPVFSNYSKSGGHGSTGQVKAGSWGKKSIKIGNVRCNKNSLIDYLNTQATLTKPLKKGRLLGWGGSSDTAVSDAVTLVFTKKQVSAPPRPATPPKPESKTPSSHSNTKDSTSLSSHSESLKDEPKLTTTEDSSKDESKSASADDASDEGFEKPVTPLSTESDPSKDIPTRSSLSDEVSGDGFKKSSKTPLKASSFSSLESPISHQKPVELSESKQEDSSSESNAIVDTIDWKTLTVAQLKNSDFTSIDKKSFDDLFPYAALWQKDRSKVQLQSYSFDQIATLQSHFDEWHWRNLSADQVKNLDISTLDKTAFDYVLSHLYTHQRGPSSLLLQSYSSDQIATLQKHFDDWHWKNLSDTQVEALDFTTMEKPVFDYLFSHDHLNQDQSKNRLQSYSSGQIAALQRHFDDWHWENLSDKQVEDLDLPTVNKTAFDALFPSVNGHKRNVSKTRLQSYSSGQIAALQRHFDQWHWENLTDNQVRNLNFAAVDKKAFDFLFPYVLKKEQNQSKTRLQSYSSDQIATMEHHFDDWHRQAIKND